jgi:hypothetical protein
MYHTLSDWKRVWGNLIQLSKKFILSHQGSTKFSLEIVETTNNTKHPKKNENYNEILEKPFIFNLQTVSMTRRPAASP